MKESCYFTKKFVTLQPISIYLYFCKMKIVKGLGICLLAILVSVGFVSCSDDEYSSRLKELIIKDLTFECDEEAGVLYHTSTFRNEDLTNYRAISDAAWCNVSIDVDKSQMTVTVDENDSFDERKAVVTLTDVLAEGISRTFTVTQKQNNVIRVSETYKTIETKGGSFEVTFEHNVNDYEVTSSANWIKFAVTRTRGLSTSKITVTVDKNDSGIARTAFLTIDSETIGEPVRIRVDQEYKVDYYFNLIKSDYTIDERGGNISVNAQTNRTSFDIFAPEDPWAKLGELEFFTELLAITQHVIVEPLTQKVHSRTTNMYLDDETITITQYRNIYLLDASVSLIQGDSYTLNLYNYEKETVKWSSSNERVVSVDGDGIVTGVGAGEATITVSSADGKHTDTVVVTVQSPQDLSEHFSVEWQPYYDVVNGVKTITSLSCTLNNESSRSIQLTRCDIYCDLKYFSTMEYNSRSGVMAPGESKKVTFDNLAGRADRFGFTVVWYYSYNGGNYEYRCEYKD